MIIDVLEKVLTDSGPLSLTLSPNPGGEGRVKGYWNNKPEFNELLKISQAIADDTIEKDRNDPIRTRGGLVLSSRLLKNKHQAVSRGARRFGKRSPAKGGMSSPFTRGAQRRITA
jgi:hypothetical protein